MASMIWRPTASTNGGSNVYTGWGAATSSSETFTFSDLHAYIDEVDADDFSTWLSTRADTDNNGNGTATFTMTGTALPSNAKISSISITVRFSVSNPNTLSANGNLYLQLLNSSSSAISTQSISLSGKDEQVWETQTKTITTSTVPKYVKMYVSNLQGGSGKSIFAVNVSQLYITINYDLYYTTTITQTTGGTISVSPSGEQKSDTKITIIATPNNGYVLNKYIVNGTETSTNTFSLTANTTISASWLLNFFIQKNSIPTRIKEIYKKINGSWVKQNNNFSTLFSTDEKYYYKNKN